jgi:tetratricopeptide (TPR) repeat protein
MALVPLAASQAPDRGAPLVTFNDDVAPLVLDACGPCHRPTGPAPFSLISYQDVRRRATQIVDVTAKRFMPPWKAEPGIDAFVGQRWMSERDLAIIRQWVAAGTPEGDPGRVPAVPQWPAGWQLGTPDLVVTLPEPFELQAESTDVFRIFVVPLPVSTTRFVRGIEFRPGNPRVVHHANIRLDRTAASRTLDAADARPGYDGLMARSAHYPDGHFLGWTPGQVAPLVPSDLAWRLEPGTDLVLQLHMQPSGAIEAVQPSIGLYFGDAPPTRTPAILRIGSQGIDIPPGEPRHIISDQYTLPVDVDLLAVQPHAHYRAQEILGTATLPDGSARTLIHIREWDFRWQHVYRYARPVALPRGTILSMRYSFDNSAANPRNPKTPPERVRWGQRSSDEMGDLWFQLLTRSERDRAILNAEVVAKMTAEDIVGYESLLAVDPDDAELHDDVALLYLGDGRAGDAVRHFEASLQLKPGSAPAHFNLGTALSVAGRLQDAIAQYRRALAIEPGYASAHNNLGSVLASVGRRTEAIPHFREAVRHDGANVQAWRNLAWHLATAEHVTPEQASEAVQAAERAANLTGRRDPHVLDALAAAFAAAGDFNRAVSTGREATRLADAVLAPEIDGRVRRYLQQQRFVDVPPK